MRRLCKKLGNRFSIGTVASLCFAANTIKWILIELFACIQSLMVIALHLFCCERCVFRSEEPSHCHSLLIVFVLPVCTCEQYTTARSQTELTTCSLSARQMVRRHLHEAEHNHPVCKSRFHRAQQCSIDASAEISETKEKRGLRLVFSPHDYPTIVHAPLN